MLNSSVNLWGFEKQTPNFWQNARRLFRDPHWAITVPFPKSVDWNKIQASSQKSDETIHDYYNRLQIVLKENSDPPSDVDFTQAAFNSMFTNPLNWDLSLLKDSDGMADNIHCRFGQFGKASWSHVRWVTQNKKTLKLFIFHSGKWRFLYKTPNLLVSAIIETIQDIGEKIVTNLSISGTF